MTVGNGAKTPFWDSLWLLGRKSKGTAPLILEASSRKNWNMREAFKNNTQIVKMKPTTIVSIEHIQQFFTL